MTRKTRRDLPEGDDGRTIASMNVEGMPWYTPSPSDAPPVREEAGASPQAEQPPMTREESRYYTWGAVKAALLVVLVICGAIALFIAFCQFVWFR